jgi:SAM-dependent methyltransferase/uncharacterized protein YbaR (Trm112 family)
MSRTIELLACPECGGALSEERAGAEGAPPGKSIICKECGEHYLRSGGSVKLLPRFSQDATWSEWSDKQALGLEEYKQLDEQSEDFQDPVAEMFGEFAGLYGAVLDIGCGLGPVPAYARSGAVEKYVGLDPLDGDREHDFDFIQGIGEQLPIRDAVFDCIVSATSLDHVVAVDRVVGEARRVLKPDGKFAVWIAVADEETLLSPLRPRLNPARAYREGGPRQLAGHCWYWSVAAPARRFALRRRFRRNPDAVIREVFADRMRYHFHFFRQEQVEGVLTSGGFAITHRRLVRDADRGNSLFLLANPVSGTA